MATLTATWDPNTGSVLLQATPTASVTAILRTDANGSNIAVRSATGQFPTSSPIVLRDFEVSHGTATYRLVSTATASANVVVTIDKPRIASVTVPSYLAVPDVTTGYDASRAPGTTVHWVVNRSTPAVTLGSLRAREGTLTFVTGSPALANELAAVYSIAEPVMLRQSVKGLDLYHVASGSLTMRVNIEPGMDETFELSVPFTETDRPLGALRGTLGWDYDDLLAAGGTYASLVPTWGTYALLAVGPVA